MKITIIKEQNEPTRTYAKKKKKSLLAYVFAVSMDVNLNEQRTSSKIKTQCLLYLKTSLVIHSIVNLSTRKIN